MKKIFTFLFFPIFFIVKAQHDGIDDYSMLVNNQINKSTIITSPESYAFQLVNTIPMNLSTGRLDLSIPIFEINEGNIQVPITLSYNSGGIKIDEMASNVGMNWSLNAGGNLSKIVRDLDDNTYMINEAYRTCNGGNHDLGICVVGRYLLYHGKNIFTYDIDGLYGVNYLTNPLAYYNEDAQYDLFIANAPGLSSQFIVKKRVTGKYHATTKEIDNTKVIVNGGYGQFELGDSAPASWIGSETIFGITSPVKGFIDHIFTRENYMNLRVLAKDYGSFQLINSQGLKYTFETYDVNTSIVDAPIFSIADNMGQYIGENTHLKFIRSNYSIKKGNWQLDKIEDPTTNKSVLFKYLKNNSNLFVENISLSDIDSSEIITNYIANTIQNNVEEIRWSGGVIKFFYQISRIDAPDRKALSEIVIEDIHQNVIKKYVFEYDYYRTIYDTNNSHDYYNYRLRLRSIAVHDSNNVDIEKHYFSYLHDWYPYKDFIPRLNDKRNQDYFGYYKRYHRPHWDDKVIVYPKLYYKENQGRYSFIPFELPNYRYLPSIEHGNFHFYDQDVSVVNNNASVGLLTEYRKPTGAIHQFAYEPNSFLFKGHEIKGGGVRLLSQKIIDRGKTNRNIFYNYNDNTNTNITTGTISNLPILAKSDYNNRYYYDRKYAKYLSTQSMGRVELTNNAFVVYGRVVEEEIGKGKTIHFFTTNDDFPNHYPNILSSDKFLENNSPLLPGVYEDYSNYRGKLKEKYTYSSDGSLLEAIKNEYKKYGYTDYSTAIKRLNHNRDQMVQIKNIDHINYSVPVFYGGLVLTRNSKKDFFNTKLVETVSDYSYTNLDFSDSTINYDSYPPFYTITNDRPHWEKNYLKSIAKQNSEGRSLKTKFTYLFEANGNYHTQLIAQNRLKIPFQTTVLDENRIVSDSKMTFKKQHDLILPFQSFTSKNRSVNEDDIRFTIDSYDSKGNITQYTLADGTPVAVIWGYHQQYPIAKIEGKGYYDISHAYIEDLQTLSNRDNDRCIGLSSNCNESVLRKRLDDFRRDGAFVHSLVTTYTYDPLIGLTSVMGQTGEVTYYDYDDFGRLRSVKNDKGQVLNSHDYHYAIP